MKKSPLIWITGLDVICHTELSEFRREQKAALDELFAQLLTVLDQAQVIKLDQVTLDGTRIRTVAGVDTFRRGKTIASNLEQARECVRSLEAGEAQEGRLERRLRLNAGHDGHAGSIPGGCRAAPATWSFTFWKADTGSRQKGPRSSGRG